MKKLFLSMLVVASIIGVSFVSVPQVRDAIMGVTSFTDAIVAIASTGNFTSATCTITADPTISPYAGAPVVLSFASSNSFATMEFNGERIVPGATTVVYPTDTTIYTVLLNGIFGCQYTVEINTPNTARICTIETDVSIGMSGDAVAEIQDVLINYGIPIVRTSIFDARTQTALKLFQFEKILKEGVDIKSTVTGVWDAKTRNTVKQLYNCASSVNDTTATSLVSEIKTSTAPTSSISVCVASDYKIGDKGDDIKTIQKWLISQGYTKVEATGTFGTYTQRAIKHFQEENAADILKPAGLTAGTGAWGLRTATKASAMGLCSFFN